MATINILCNLFFRPGGFGARDYRNPGQLRNNRGGGGGRPASSTSGYNNHQPQQWDVPNGSAGGNMWSGGDHQSGGAAGYDRYQQPTTGGNGNRQADQSWWDSTS